MSDHQGFGWATCKGACNRGVEIHDLNPRGLCPKCAQWDRVTIRPPGEEGDT